MVLSAIWIFIDNLSFIIGVWNDCNMLVWQESCELYRILMCLFSVVLIATGRSVIVVLNDCNVYIAVW